MYTGRLSLRFQHTWEQQIWKVQIDPLAPYLVLLLREEQTKNCRLCSIDLDTGLHSEIQIESPWLPDLIKAYKGLIFLHYYPDPQLPQTLGLSCYESKSLFPLWHNYRERIFAIYDSSVCLYEPKVSPIKLKYRDLKTGDTLSETNIPAKEADLVFPKQDEEGWNLSLASGYHIYTRYRQEADKTTEWLFVQDTNGDLLLEEDLGNSGYGDSFFVYDNQLVYIRHKQELKIYAL